MQWLSSYPQNIGNWPGVVVYYCNPSMEWGPQRQVDPWKVLDSQSGWIYELQVQWKTSKKKDTWHWAWVPGTDTFTCIPHIHTYQNKYIPCTHEYNVTSQIIKIKQNKGNRSFCELRIMAVLCMLVWKALLTRAYLRQRPRRKRLKLCENWIKHTPSRGKSKWENSQVSLTRMLRWAFHLWPWFDSFWEQRQATMQSPLTLGHEHPVQTLALSGWMSLL